MSLPIDPATSSPGILRARERIAIEKEARTGFLDLGDLGLTEWVDELWELHHLTGLNLGVGWLDENTGFHFAGPGLHASQNILPTAGAQWHRLPDLRILSFAGERGAGSPWADLRGLACLKNLCVLDLSFTDVDDLSPLAGLPHLQVLDASYTFIDNVISLSSLGELRCLDLCHTKITDLTPLASCAALNVLFIDSTSVMDLTPLASLQHLRKLHFTSSHVVDLSPLSNQHTLETLRLSWTSISCLEPLTSLPNLRLLECCNTSVTHFPERLVRLPSLETLVLHENPIANVPIAVLSSDGTKNCLETARVWFDKHPEAMA